ncbi:MAG: hypothetical protein ACK2UO_03010 [Caldilineaceae bacterium]
MYGKTTIALLLGLILFAMAACGPAMETGSQNMPGQTEQTDAAAGDSSRSESSVAMETSGASSSDITSTLSVTGVQSLEWGDPENCIMPGLAITGTDGSLAPCEPVDQGDEDNAEMTETPVEDASMPEETPVMPSTDQPQTQAEDDYSARMTALAIEDLSQRLGLPADEIEVSGVETVTWPDSSMGCPQPDMMYAQMLQEGVLIQLYANDQTYSYHAGGNQPPFLCEEDL